MTKIKIFTLIFTLALFVGASNHNESQAIGKGRIRARIQKILSRKIFHPIQTIQARRQSE